MKRAPTFDRAYYDRFYGKGRPRRKDREAAQRLGDYVFACLRYLGQPVRSVLDLGCGLGLWRDAVTRHCPAARYRGVEISPYLCDKYGWERGSVVDFDAGKRADLVICQDTLQYLPSADAGAAIKNLARLCKGALYFSALTEEDWAENCDRGKTDSNVHKRPASWYRSRLQRRFFNLGGGMFLRRDSEIVVWELEKLG
jgi:SAM-dependent methyltransferase